MLNKLINKIKSFLCIDDAHEREVTEIKDEIINKSISTQSKIEYANYILRKTITGDINSAIGGKKL